MPDERPPPKVSWEIMEYMTKTMFELERENKALKEEIARLKGESS